MKAVAALCLILGVAIAALGGFLGLESISRHSTDCGAAFIGSSGKASEKDAAIATKAGQDAEVQALTDALEGRPAAAEPAAATDTHAIQNACDSALSSRRTIALVLVVPGIALIIGGGVVGAMSEKPTPA